MSPLKPRCGTQTMARFIANRSSAALAALPPSLSSGAKKSARRTSTQVFGPVPVATQSPSIEVVKAKLVGFGVVYDRIILPQRHPDRPEWVLSYTNGRLLISDTGGRR